MTTALNLANHASFLDTNNALPLNGSGVSNILPTTKGGTGLNYTPVAADVGKQLTVTQTGTGASATYQFGLQTQTLLGLKAINADGSNAGVDYYPAADGNGNLVWHSPAGVASVVTNVPAIPFTATTSGANQTFTSGLFVSTIYNSATQMEVLWNGVALVPNEDFTYIAGTGVVQGTLTILATIAVGDSIEVAPAVLSTGTGIPTYTVLLTQGQTTVSDASLGLYNSVLDLEVTINGITLVPGEDYTLTGPTVTLLLPVQANDVFIAEPSAQAGRSTASVWTSPTGIPINGFVVASSPTFVAPGGIRNGTLTLLQPASTVTNNGMWLNLGAIAATGNGALWYRLA